MSRVEVTVSGKLREGLNVGDTFPIEATARVIAIEEELVDVSGYGQAAGSVVVPGERLIKILVTL